MSIAHFLNNPSDISWLFSTHLKGNIEELPSQIDIKSFAIYGNEDCPWRIDLFKMWRPQGEVPTVLIYCENNQSYEVCGNNYPRTYRDYCEITGKKIKGVNDWVEFYKSKS